MYEVRKNETGSAAELILNDPAIIQYASEIKDVLDSLYESINSLEIDQSKAANFDLSYLQILISLKQVVDRDGKSLKLKGTDNPAFISLLNECGCPPYDWLSDKT